MQKLIYLIISVLLLSSCATIKKNIDSNYKQHSVYRANNFKKPVYVNNGLDSNYKNR